MIFENVKNLFWKSENVSVFANKLFIYIYIYIYIYISGGHRLIFLIYINLTVILELIRLI